MEGPCNVQDVSYLQSNILRSHKENEVLPQVQEESQVLQTEADGQQDLPQVPRQVSIAQERQKVLLRSLQGSGE